MDGIVPKLRFASKQKLLMRMRRCRDARLKGRYLIIINLGNGRSPAATAEALEIAPSTVYRVAHRFRQMGEAGLFDQREDNGPTKLDEEYLTILYDLVKSHPQEHGWRRPTWTREMLVKTMCGRTSNVISPAPWMR